LPGKIEMRTGLSKVPAAYQIAEHLLVTDIWTDALTPYTTDEGVTWSEEGWLGDMAALRDGVITYADKGWIGNEWRQVDCRSSESGYLLHISGLASFWISADGQRITLLQAEPDQATKLLSETALGAPFILALAVQDVYALHVSVVQAGDQLIAFAGESGRGKTTLARYLGLESGPGWERIIDDTLPVRVNQAGEVEALSHFPQLKMIDAFQPLHLVSQCAPLSVLYILDTEAAGREKAVQIEPLSRGESAMAVVQHTVASRLFDRQLLARHLAFCDDFSADVPVRRLIYPRRLEYLPRVREALVADLDIS